MLNDTPRSRMWESCLSGSERGWGTTMIRKRYSGTAAKAGGNRENEHQPKSLESPFYSKMKRISIRFIRIL